jgi:murein DD-endopeptidase MepM/ murein hydrolase activator NlpD
MILISHEATQTETLYGHLQGFAEGLREGQKISRFDVIGYVGNTGRTTGTHLHYAVRNRNGWQNPIYYILDVNESY